MFSPAFHLTLGNFGSVPTRGRRGRHGHRGRRGRRGRGRAPRAATAAWGCAAVAWGAAATAAAAPGVPRRRRGAWPRGRRFLGGSSNGRMIAVDTPLNGEFEWELVTKLVSKHYQKPSVLEL